MSKGLGKLQRAIVGLLDGTLKHQVFSAGGALATSELLAELVALGLLEEDLPRKTAMSTVRRACHSLLDRGILEGEYSIDCDYPWAQVASWRINRRKKANLKSG